MKKDFKQAIEMIDNGFLNLKIAMRNAEKNNINVSELYKQLDNLGIEIYQIKKMLEKIQ